MNIIAFIGPPHSGKSTVLHNIYNALRAEGRQFFLHRACPDGEGQWTLESENGVELARQHKRAVTDFFDEQFVQYQVDAVRNLSKFFPLVLVDTGGKMSRENEAILRECTHYILLVSTSYPSSVVEEWRRWAGGLGLQELAVYRTAPENLAGIADEIVKIL